MKLPEHIESLGTDMPSYYIRVETDNGSHTVGGYSADSNNSRAGIRFRNVLQLLRQLCRD